MKLTPANVGKALGYALVAAGLSLGSFHAGRAAPAEAKTAEVAPAQPARSAPALTAADLDGMRGEVRAVLGEMRANRVELGQVRERLSAVEGYLKGEREARLGH